MKQIITLLSALILVFLCGCVSDEHKMGNYPLDEDGFPYSESKVVWPADIVFIVE